MFFFGTITVEKFQWPARAFFVRSRRVETAARLHVCFRVRGFGFRAFCLFSRRRRLSRVANYRLTTSSVCLELFVFEKICVAI